MQKRTININKMTRAQLDQLYAQSEAITPQTASRKLDAQDRALHRRAGRPRVGAGAKRINVTIEQTLLEKVDAYARKRRITRASLITEGLQKVLAA